MECRQPDVIGNTIKRLMNKYYHDFSSSSEKSCLLEKKEVISRRTSWTYRLLLPIWSRTRIPWSLHVVWRHHNGRDRPHSRNEVLRKPKYCALRRRDRARWRRVTKIDLLRSGILRSCHCQVTLSEMRLATKKMMSISTSQLPLHHKSEAFAYHIL